MRSYFAILLVVVTGCGKVNPTNSPDAPAIDAPTGTGAATIALAKPSRWVPQGGSTPVAFTITRVAATTGAVTVHITGLPAGVTAADVAVAATDTTGTITFAATTASALGSSADVNATLLDGATLLDSKPFTVKVSGAPGTLDTTFGTAGRVVFPLPDPVVAATTGNGYSRAITQYPASAGADAGKVVIAVEIETTGPTSTTHKLGLVRLNVDGTTDTTFGGSTGYALIDGSPADVFFPAGVAVDSQGRVVVSATREHTFCDNVVARVTAIGTPDTGFTTYDANPFGYCGNNEGVAILPGDKIEVLGMWNENDTGQRPTLVQLNSDGSLDTTAFAGTSSAINLPNPDTTKITFLPNDLVIDAMGRYLVPGVKCDGGWNANLAACESVLGRITAAGTWDTTFGTAGAGNLGYSALVFGTTAATPQSQAFGSLAIDASGNVVTGGWSENYTTGTLARFLGTTGAIDTSFGTSGRVTPVLVSGGTVQEIDNVLIDEDGQIVVAGYAYNGGPLLANTRYSAAGVLDTSYGTAGVQTATAAALSPKAILQADGRLVVVGSYPRSGSGYDIAIWRFWP